MRAACTDDLERLDSCRPGCNAGPESARYFTNFILGIDTLWSLQYFKKRYGRKECHSEVSQEM